MRDPFATLNRSVCHNAFPTGRTLRLSQFWDAQTTNGLGICARHPASPLAASRGQRWESSVSSTRLNGLDTFIDRLRYNSHMAEKKRVPADREIVERFVEYLRDKGQPDLKIDS